VSVEEKPSVLVTPSLAGTWRRHAISPFPLRNELACHCLIWMRWRQIWSGSRGERELMPKHGVLAASRLGKRLFLAVSDPTNLQRAL